MTLEQIVKDLGIKHEIKNFVHSSKTELIEDTLYYKNIPSALLRLNHQDKCNSPISDDSFEVKGTMIDLSRNAVFNLDYFKSVIKRQALLGFNEIWLYMEDVYELKDYKKFGYLRGKYSQTDLVMLDQYASLFGVSLVPCIQTLGHMSQFLRWPSSDYLTDQKDVLLVDKSDDFIHAMIEFCRNTFMSKKIHVGMDETFGFGFGNYYKKNGYTNPEDLFLKHLNKVNEICLKNDYADVCIWSDMFFRHRSETNYYYDSSINFEAELLEKIPKNITMVYWDYYNRDIDIYRNMIKKHQEMNLKVVMASGTWIWTKLAYDREKTLSTATNAIKASLEAGLKEIIFTQWQDDGAYCDYETSFLGLYDVTNVMLKTKIKPEYLSKIECKSESRMVIDGNINNLDFSPVHLLWDDLLLGIYLNNLVGYDDQLLTPLIKNVTNHLKLYQDRSIHHHMLIATVLKDKLELRKHLLEAYFKTKDFKSVIKTAKGLEKSLEMLVSSFESMWHERYRAFGLEIIQNRIFSQIRRIKEVYYWIDIAEKNGKIPFLEEVLSKEPYLSIKFMDIAFSSKH